MFAALSRSCCGAFFLMHMLFPSPPSSALPQSPSCPFPIPSPLPPSSLPAVPNSTVESSRLWLSNPCGYECPISCSQHTDGTSAGGERPDFHWPQKPPVGRCLSPLAAPGVAPSPDGEASQHGGLCRGARASRRGRAPAVPLGLGPMPAVGHGMKSVRSSPSCCCPGPELTFSLIASLPALHLHVRAALSRTASGLRRVGELCK